MNDMPEQTPARKVRIIAVQKIQPFRGTVGSVARDRIAWPY
jgi:hypothetical protein